MAASSRSKQDDPHGLHKNLTDQTATECCIIFTALTRLLPHCRWTCSRQQQVWGVIHIKPMSKIVHGACIKPDVAATLQVEMQLPAAGGGGGVTHIKPMSKIAHGACMKPEFAVTLQMEMQLPAAGVGCHPHQAHVKDSSWSLHAA